ncbi:hypothetical protein IH992_30535 [Candidatus Poribacteria bacterium]|nr:hypothetical protein [Candidatus Poribacteria bacterium]
MLLENGADVNAADKNGETPLFDAIRSTIKDGEKKKAGVVALLSGGARPNFENDKGVTPLRVAQRKRRKEAAEIAISCGSMPGVEQMGC